MSNLDDFGVLLTKSYRVFSHVERFARNRLVFCCKEFHVTNHDRLAAGSFSSSFYHIHCVLTIPLLVM
jgi:hypothetical protein